jgi:sugar phosphate isomerase/epimerase
VFGLAFDIGHNAGASVDDEAIIMNYPGRLRHMHVHDAVGSKNHLGLGDGNLDIGRYLGMAQTADCRVVLETKTTEALRRSVQWIRERQHTEGFRI